MSENKVLWKRLVAEGSDVSDKHSLLRNEELCDLYRSQHSVGL
jgi:hypothetical protein